MFYNSITDFAVFLDDMIQVSREPLYDCDDANYLSRLLRDVESKMHRQILTRPYKRLLIFVNGTSITSTSSSMKFIPMTMAFLPS